MLLSTKLKVPLVLLLMVGSSAVHNVVPPPAGGVTTGGTTTGGTTTGGTTTGGVTTGGVTTGVVGAAPPLFVVAMAVTAAFDSGLVSVGSGLKLVESAVKPAVCELVATLAKITAAKFLPASVNVAAVAGNEPLLALASAAMSLMLCSNVLPAGTAWAKEAK
jgi:hypothetical protein